jgi:hypothetical protein
MFFNIYLRKGIVFMPTSGLVHQGLHRDIEPVAVVPVFNTDAVRQAFTDTISRGNPPTPHYTRGSHPQPVVLKYAGAKSWAAFARGTSSWSIKKKDGSWQIVSYRTHRDGHWEEDPEQVTTFPLRSSLGEVIDRMIAILQDAARK